MGYEVKTNTDLNGDVESYILIFDDGSRPESYKANAKNKLLFEEGMYEFIEGQEVRKLNDNPEVIIGSSEETYLLSVDGSIIETMPSQASDFLEGVLQSRQENSTQKLQALHQNIISDQVRRRYINLLVSIFDESRIDTTTNGWLVDGFILVTWDASVYLKDDDKESYERVGNEAVKVDKSKQFVKVEVPIPDEPDTITIDGTEITLTEREMMFLRRVEWLLHRRDYHPDTPFWDFAERWMPNKEEVDDGPKPF